MPSLAAYLRSLTQEQLAGLVAIRRDATLEPAPRTAEELAERLLHPSSTVAACALLTRIWLRRCTVSPSLPWSGRGTAAWPPRT